MYVIRREWYRGLGLHELRMMMSMRIAVNLDDKLFDEAKNLTGIGETTPLIHAGLEALVAREAARRLAALGGSEPNIRAIRRRRPLPRKSR